MSYDLDAMSRQELLKLRSDVERAIASLADREKRKAIEAAERAAREYGFSLAELTGAALPRGKGGRKAKGQAKYRNPADPSQEWSGKGRRPFWVNDALAAGKGLSDLAV